MREPSKEVLARCIHTYCFVMHSGQRHFVNFIWPKDFSEAVNQKWFVNIGKSLINCSSISEVTLITSYNELMDYDSSWTVKPHQYPHLKQWRLTIRSTIREIQARQHKILQATMPWKSPEETQVQIAEDQFITIPFLDDWWNPMEVLTLQWGGN